MKVVTLLQVLFGTFATYTTASTQKQHHDVLIIGGGLSGLGAAKHLIEAGKDVLVLEARNRTGGRVHNVEWPSGGYTEVGAEFIGPTQDKVIALASELGLELYKEYDTGKNTYLHKGKKSFFDSDSPLGAFPPVDNSSLIQLASVQSDLDEMASEINIEAPWNSSHAAKYDSITFEDWLKKRSLTKDAYFLIKTATESIFSVEPKALSFLYTLAYIRASGNETSPGTFQRLTSTPDGAQMYKVNGGTELLASRLASKLGGEKVIRLNSHVRMIEKADTTYKVTLSDNQFFTAESVVVAMSPPLAGQITYSPPLPNDRVQLTKRMSMGSIGKAVALYDKPFWRDDGLTGQAFSDTGLARVTFDNCEKNATYGALMGFLEAEHIRKYDGASEQTIIDQVTKDFTNLFGEKAQSAKAWIVQRWDLEPFSQGGPVAIAPPKVLTKYGQALKNRVGNLHFAGTESSNYWIGYMDGALRSGYRAATEILSA